MKKIMKFLMCLLLSIVLVPLMLQSSKSAFATSQVFVSYTDFASETNSIFAEFLKFNERLAGSESEKKAAEYIKKYLSEKTSLSPKNNSYVENGVQTFTFESDFSGLYETSQNIIFEHKTNKENAKKVILTCNYDAVAYKISEDGYYYEHVNTEGVNTSAGSVASLLAMAKYFPYGEVDFDVEFVFYGASESSNAGANIYAQGISDEDAKNILCVINLDNVALGENIYFYSDEIETEFSKFVTSVARDKKLNIEQVKITNLNKIILGVENELGFDYEHIAMNSENVKFMKRGIVTMNIFAGDYEGQIVVGRQEYSGKEVVAYTQNDTVEYITEKFGFDCVTENLFDVYKSVSSILTNDGFVNAATNASGSTNWLYVIFANKKLVVWLTAVALVVFIVVAMYIHYKLSIKAYHANVEVEFLSSVVKISESIDQTGIDANVPKVVGQVLANDIKKDKVIKVKKNKKDK